MAAHQVVLRLLLSQGNEAVGMAPVDEVPTDPPVKSSGRFRLTEDDSVQAVKLDARPSVALLIIYGAPCLVLLWLCIVGSLSVKIVAGFGLLGGIIGEAVTRHIIVPARRRQSFRRNELLHNEFTIEISGQNIRIFSSKTDFTLTAANLVKWKEGKDHILIYAAPRTYFTIPKRVADGTFSLDALRAALRHHAGAPAR